MSEAILYPIFRFVFYYGYMIRTLLLSNVAPAPAAVRKMRNAGCKIDWCSTMDEGYRRALAGGYAAIILDIPPVRENGEMTARMLREANRRTPVLWLAPSAEVAQEWQFNPSNEACLVKPFCFEEFKTQLEALLKRKCVERVGTFPIADLTIDAQARTVSRNGKLLPLTARQFDLLLILAERVNETVSKEDILAAWGSWDNTSNSVEVHLSALRRKLSEGAQNAPLIRTVYGQGYILGEGKSSSATSLCKA